MQVLSPTYKSRSEDFKRIFKGVSNDERLIVGKCHYSALTWLLTANKFTYIGGNGHNRNQLWLKRKW